MKKILLLTGILFILAWCNQTTPKTDTTGNIKTWENSIKQNVNTWNTNIINTTWNINSWNNLNKINDPDTKEILNVMNGLIK